MRVLPLVKVVKSTMPCPPVFSPSICVEFVNLQFEFGDELVEFGQQVGDCWQNRVLLHLVVEQQEFFPF